MPALFAFVCLIWGTTWIAMKLGVASVPPIFYGGTRFAVAGLALLLWALWRGTARRLTRAELGRLLVIQLLMVVLTYAPLFWAIVFVPSGLSAVLDLALMPVSLVLFGLILGEERWSVGRAAALGLGLAGLAVLFGPQVVAPSDPRAFWGLLAIAFSAVVYSLGSVVARPLTQSTDSIYLSGLTLLPGGLVLLLGALAAEPGAALAARLEWPATAWSGWLFLVVFGSLVAFTGYLRLISAWGPAKAGSYAYVSPVIAVVVGIAFLGESVTLRDAAGALLLLAAAFCSLQTRAVARPRAVAARAR